MKYILMMHAPRGTGEYQVGSWSPDDFNAHIAFMHRLNADLAASGELAGAEGLASPAHARIVRAGKNGGAPAVTGGTPSHGRRAAAGGRVSVGVVAQRRSSSGCGGRVVVAAAGGPCTSAWYSFVFTAENISVGRVGAPRSASTTQSASSSERPSAWSA